MGIVRFALRFPHTFYVVAALILFLGGAALWSMPTDIFPEIRIPVVTVIWQYTGLSTPEMEQRVSTYSQYSISANVNGIKNMESQTMVCRCRRSISSPTSISTWPSRRSFPQRTPFVR
ncbi:multidrug efflux pump subunit AcrB [Bradyrhizobium sp. S3.3.6]